MILRKRSFTEQSRREFEKFLKQCFIDVIDKVGL